MFNHLWAGKPGKEKIVPGTFYEVEGPADFYVEEMEIVPTLRRVALAVEFAILEDPGCIEAHLFMGTRLLDKADAMDHLKHAVEVGDALWAPAVEAEGDDMPWWGCMATRPYMRAIHALGLAHLDAGNEDEAQVQFDRLLKMNPNDNQGIRFLVDEVGTEMSLSP